MLDNVIIAPSVLSADFGRLAEELDDVATADWIHYDVMDGHFVPNLSFGLSILKTVKKNTSLPVDVHLMITNPDEMVDAWLDAGADVLCFHQEAATHCHRIISRIHERGAKAAMALNPGTSPYVLDSIISELDMVLVMSVNPGYGGQAFIESSLEKIRAVRALAEARGVHPLIEVDGGIGAGNADLVCDAGADVLVVGSSVFGADDRAQAIADIRASGNRGKVKRS